MKYFVYLIDNSAGDGSTQGFCPSSKKCFNAGDCAVCKSTISASDVSNGCSGTTPICEKNSQTCAKCKRM